VNTTSIVSSSGTTVCHGAEIAAFRLAAILESSPDAIIGQDLDGIITDWNKGAEKIFGHTAGEIIGTSILRLVPDGRPEETNFILEKIRRGENAGPFETLGETKDGRLIHIKITAAPVRDGEGKIFGGLTVVRDITVQKQHERELARLTRLYSALSHLNQAIVQTGTRADLFQKICQVLVTHGRFHAAWVGWHDPQTHQLVPVGVWGDDRDFFLSLAVYGDDRPQGHGPTGLAFRAGRPCVCNDLANDPATLPWRPELVRRGIKASAVFPIQQKHEVRGTLTVYADEPWFFQDKEISLLVEAAGDVSLALDNLAQKEARQEVERIALNEKIFSATMIESIPGILYFYDAQGRFLRWNRNFEIVSGYSGEEIARMHPLDFFSGDEKELLRQRIAEVFATGKSSVEASFMAKDGTATPYFFTGQRIIFNGAPCLVGMGVDISERKRAEWQLHETQGQLEAVVENLREGLVIADPEGELLRWNQASLLMLGFTDFEEGRRLQRDFAFIFELHTLDGVRLAPDQWPLSRVRRGESVDNCEIRVRRPGSDWERILSYSGSLVRHAGIKTLAFLTLHDITEQKRTELALRVLNKTLELEVSARTGDLQDALVRAEAADRIKSAFLATMSHELRTPLNSIIGFTGIVLQGLAGPLTAEQTKQLGMVRNSARHLLELINDVLDLSKIEAGQMEVRAAPFSLRASLEHVIAVVKPFADKKNLTLTLAAPPDLGEVMTDRRRVEQLLLNLLNNGLKFTEHGGVTLTTEIIADYKPAPDGPPQPAMRLRVTDTGMGIKPENLPMLFQPFRQLDTGTTRQHEGTGLGLAICRRLATLLGGEIGARSEWTKGSEFIATIPLQKQDPP
jgi:PAS domain S-box-containing protein